MSALWVLYLMFGSDLDTTPIVTHDTLRALGYAVLLVCLIAVIFELLYRMEK